MAATCARARVISSTAWSTNTRSRRAFATASCRRCHRRRHKTLIDVNDVGKRSGEFIAEQLEAVASELDVVNGACDEIVKHAGAGRSWLVFCVGVMHAELVRDALRARGINAEMVLGETHDDERDRIIEDFRAGRLTCIVSVMVLSYGFNVPFVDLIALLRPTCSTGLYVQQVGRGTRKADGKD